jgi:hypothetical protein
MLLANKAICFLNAFQKIVRRHVIRISLCSIKVVLKNIIGLFFLFQILLRVLIAYILINYIYIV